MADLDLKQIDAKTGRAPKQRIADAASLNSVVRKIVEADLPAAISRSDVQQMLDSKPPFDDTWLDQTGQTGRCNLNFQDGKKEVKRKQLGFYDLTDSVPVLGFIQSEYGDDIIERDRYDKIKSEEFHRMHKDWPSFGTYFQLLVQKFCSHGVGFVYRSDDLDWRWYVAGMEDFKVPRMTTLAEDESDVAVCFRDITVGKLYKWAFIEADPGDTRWNRQEVKEAILKAADPTSPFSDGAWEKWEAMLKNNDLFASMTAQEIVQVVHAWVVEYDGKVSQYLTLRKGGNKDFLFKCQNRFDSVHQCFSFFPYEVGSNGYLHSVRGRAHEIYPQAQTLNVLKCQSIDNARLAGSLLLQPKTPEDQEDLAITFYGGATYIPANVTVQNGELNNPSQGMLPVIQDMSFSIHDEGIPQAPPTTAGDRKTKYQVQDEQTKAAVLDVASLTLFYNPWKRVLNESLRRVRNKRLKKTDPGGKEVHEYWRRCRKRGVPDDSLFDETQWIEPMRAVGFGSPGNRLLAFDEFMNFYGSLDPVGQNNLLRDRFAQKVGYAQVDRYVPEIGATGRQPMDAEMAELQNVAMSTGVPMIVLPNDHHILHMFAHLPSIETDLTNIESDQGDPVALLQVVQIKLQHMARHMELLKPDKLNEKVVAELKRRFNNAAERVQAAVLHAQRAAARQQAESANAQQEAAQGPPPDPKALAEAQAIAAKTQRENEAHQLEMQQKAEKHALDMKILNEQAAQTRALRDAEAAMKFRDKTLPTPVPTPAVPVLTR